MEKIALNLGLINDLLILYLIVCTCLWLTITFTSFYLIVTIKTSYGEIIHLTKLRTVALTVDNIYLSKYKPFYTSYCTETEADILNYRKFDWIEYSSQQIDVWMAAPLSELN